MAHLTTAPDSTGEVTPATGKIICAVTDLGHRVLRYGLVVVIGWIGMMKFTGYEAQGIEPLVAHSPLLSWMYGLWTVRQFAAGLGVVEISIAILIALRPWSRKASAIGSAAAVLMFLTTLSFLASTPGWEPSLGGFPALSGAVGQFLIKDLVLIGAAIWSLGEALISLEEPIIKTLNTRKDNAMQTPHYFTAYRSLRLTRDANGVLVAEFHSNGGPFTFTAQDHTELVDAFYRIAQDRSNKVVILTGVGREFIPGIDFSSFGNVADPGVWSQVHDEGVQIVENIANIRVPLIAAVEGRAHVHSEYALLANVIVAAEDATFQDLPHFGGGIVPGDGIFTTWSYRAGAGRAEAFLLNPQPLTARTAQEWGVVAEVVPNGKALARARELAALYLKVPEVTRRNTRVHFIQPLKERIVREVGYGLSLEGASAADLVKSMQSKTELEAATADVA